MRLPQQGPHGTIESITPKQIRQRLKFGINSRSSESLNSRFSFILSRAGIQSTHASSEGEPWKAEEGGEVREAEEDGNAGETGETGDSGTGGEGGAGRDAGKIVTGWSSAISMGT
mmetsp:Transcript_4173/g.6520  ORF Transcript_4173/g.6520 Transcript_4173/m.6520 type:complete len:115 (-) Transcript_4173:602-946(-)